MAAAEITIPSAGRQIVSFLLSPSATEVAGDACDGVGCSQSLVVSGNRVFALD